MNDKGMDAAATPESVAVQPCAECGGFSFPNREQRHAKWCSKAVAATGEAVLTIPPGAPPMTEPHDSDALPALRRLREFFDAHCTASPDCPLPHSSLYAACEEVAGLLAERDALREAAGRAFDAIDVYGAREDSARNARNILGPALTACDRSASRRSATHE